MDKERLVEGCMYTKSLVESPRRPAIIIGQREMEKDGTRK